MDVIFKELKDDTDELRKDRTPETFAKIAAANKEALDKAKASLTAAQKEKLKDLLGEPITITFTGRPMKKDN